MQPQAFPSTNPQPPTPGSGPGGSSGQPNSPAAPMPTPARTMSEVIAPRPMTPATPQASTTSSTVPQQPAPQAMATATPQPQPAVQPPYPAATPQMPNPYQMGPETLQQVAAPVSAANMGATAAVPANPAAAAAGATPQPTTPSPTNGQLQSLPPTSQNNRPVWQALRGFISFFGFVASVVVLASIINLFVFQSYYVDGTSMHPTLEPNERLIINKLPQSLSKASGNHYTPKRGEIIVFNSELISPINGKPEQLIKRVIGLPGERIVVKDNKITVYNQESPNGFNPDEQLGLKLSPTDGDIDVVVPQNEFFVSGDNREPGGSYDSRNELGMVPSHRIVGELLIRLVPLNKAKFF